jgi:hypothetical protein
MMEATLTYLADMAERPAYYLYPPPPGVSWRNTRGDRRRLPVHDARAALPPPSLDGEGFALGRLETAVENPYDPDAVRAVYYGEVERVVREVSGAARVVAFDFNVRNEALAEHGARGVQKPVRYAHNDYTERSGPQRVRDLFPAEAERLLRRRVAVINAWKPIRGPVQRAPLAVCDARTIAAVDLVPTDLHYRDRNGEVYSLRFNPAHRWFYYPRMEASEVLLLKCFDSARTVARFTAHTAFDDPTAPPDTAARESIEVRTLAFFAT